MFPIVYLVKTRKTKRRLSPKILMHAHRIEFNQFIAVVHGILKSYICSFVFDVIYLHFLKFQKYNTQEVICKTEIGK